MQSPVPLFPIPRPFLSLLGLLAAVLTASAQPAGGAGVFPAASAAPSGLQDFQRDPAVLHRILKQTWKGTYNQPFVYPDYRRQTITGNATLAVLSIKRNDDPHNFPGAFVFEADYTVKLLVNGSDCYATSRMRGSIFLNHTFTLLVVTSRYTNRGVLPGGLKWDANPPTGTFVLSKDGAGPNPYRLTGTLGMQKEIVVALHATGY